MLGLSTGSARTRFWSIVILLGLSGIAATEDFTRESVWPRFSSKLSGGTPRCLSSSMESASRMCVDQRRQLPIRDGFIAMGG
jgi:hypothetical protein